MNPTVEVMSNRDFRFLAVGQVLSALGDGAALVAVSFAVLQATGSLSSLGLVLGARYVCLGAFLLIGGVVGDRVSRRHVLVVSDLARALAQGALAVLLLVDQVQLWQCVVLQTCYGTAEAFFGPAKTGLVPEIVPAGERGAANAVNEMIFGTSRAAGPAIGGLLVIVAGTGGAVAFDAVTFLVSAAMIARIRVRRDPQGRVAEATSPQPGWRSELVEGLRQVWQRRWLSTSVLCFIVLGALTVPAILVLGPAASWRGLGGVAGWSALTSAFGVGALTGSLLAASLTPRRPGVVLMGALMVTALRPATFVLGWPLPAVAAYSYLAGAALSIAAVVWAGLLQGHVPADSLSRVGSIDDLGSSVLTPAGYLLAAPMATAFGIVPTLIGLAVVPVATCGVALSVRDLRTLQWTAPATGAQPRETPRLNLDSPLNRQSPAPGLG